MAHPSAAELVEVGSGDGLERIEVLGIHPTDHWVLLDWAVILLRLLLVLDHHNTPVAFRDEIAKLDSAKEIAVV